MDYRSLIILAALGIGSMAMAQDYAVPDDAVVINAHDSIVELNPKVWNQLYAPSDWHYEVRQAFYSQARLYDSSMAGDDAYRLGQAASINGVYQPFDGFEVGLEYEWARRTNANLECNHANRLTLMCSYTF